MGWTAVKSRGRAAGTKIVPCSLTPHSIATLQEGTPDYQLATFLATKKGIQALASERSRNRRRSDPRAQAMLYDFPSPRFSS